MVKILHTADIQIGKPYSYISDSHKRHKVQQARINIVERIINIAKEKKVEFILVAGDMFDSNTIRKDIIMEVLEILSAVSIPVLVIPGNHDHGGPGGIWNRTEVKSEINKRAPLLRVLNKSEPIILDSIIILPCPLNRQKELEITTEWIKHIDFNGFNKDLPRVVIAHGSIHGFSKKDYDVSNPSIIENNLLDLENLPLNEIDYVALGDWHSLKQITKKAWYSGTPEQDRFNINKQDMRSQVLIVDVQRNREPVVEIVSTSEIKWSNLRISLRDNNDIQKLKKYLDNIIGSRVGKDLLRIELDGQLCLEDYNDFKEVIDRLEEQLLHLRIKGKCSQRPSKNELLSIIGNNANPLISSIANKLLIELDDIVHDEIKSSAEDLRRVRIIELQLIELYKLCKQANTEVL